MTTSQATLRTVVVAGVGMTAFANSWTQHQISCRRVSSGRHQGFRDGRLGQGIETIYYANTASGILQVSTRFADSTPCAKPASTGFR